MFPLSPSILDTGPGLLELLLQMQCFVQTLEALEEGTQSIQVHTIALWKSQPPPDTVRAPYLVSTHFSLKHDQLSWSERTWVSHSWSTQSVPRAVPNESHILFNCPQACDRHYSLLPYYDWKSCKSVNKSFGSRSEAKVCLVLGPDLSVPSTYHFCKSTHPQSSLGSGHPTCT